MPSTLRTFIALELPPSLISLLAKVQEDLQSMGLRAKWVRPGNIHLTLKFLGNINSADIDNIGRAMVDAVGNINTFNLVAEGIGVFPGIKRPRVIWVGLKGQVQLLFAMQRLLEDNLAALGYKKEKRPFKGHLTLGRFKQRVNPDTIRRVLQELGDLTIEEFTARRVIFYKSDLKPTGARYSQLQEASFNDD
ncbi:MAG: RNA 2',3'-cyclic phosphodiesterase [Desulfobacterales bacterium]|jgi:2'-5' RNA ligase